MRFEVRKLEWGAGALLGLAALWAHGLRFVHAGGLWRDEAGLVRCATLPSLGALWRLFPRESFPLPVVLALRLYVRIAGGGDLALRGLGMAVGLAIAGALWLAARSTGRTLPLLSLALVETNAAFVVFGDSIRGYGLGSLCILLSFAAMARLLAHPGPLAPAGTAALLAALAAVAAVHSLFGNAVLVAALCAAAAIAALWSGRRRVAVAAAAIAVAAALSLLPYAAAVQAARSWTVLVSHPIDRWQSAQVLAAVLGPAAPAWLVLVGLGLAGAAWRLVRCRRSAAAPDAGPDAGDRRDGALRLFNALVIVLGIAAQLLFLGFLSYTPRAWYDLPLLALVGAALETLIADLCRARWARLARAGFALALAAVLLVAALPRLRMRMTNADLVARRLAQAASGGDLVVVFPWHFGISFDRYYRGPASWMTLPQLADHQMHRYDLLKERLAASGPIDDVLQSVRGALAGGRRVWLVGELRIPPPGRPPPILAPAPDTPWGWDDYPYGVSWQLQLGALLRDHAAALRAVPVPSADPVSPLENMRLAAADGWRTLRLPSP
jgi:hypothetical protein